MSHARVSAVSDASRFSPEGLASSGTEHGEQAALFAWANMAYWLGVTIADDMRAYGLNSPWQNEFAVAVRDHAPRIPELRWLHAIPNGGERGKASAGNMKAEGVKRGVADIFWPVAHCGHHGLYIEMKRRNGVASDVTPEQRLFKEFVTYQNYRWVWTRGWLDARNVLIDYARGNQVEGLTV